MFTEPTAVIAVAWCSHRHLWVLFDFQLETRIAQKSVLEDFLDAVSQSRQREAEDNFKQD